jgi:endonuclease-8
MRFDNDLSLHTHMRMRGAWHLYPRDVSWRRGTTPRVLLDFSDWVAVLFSAPTVNLVRQPEPLLEHLGPDILAEEFEVGEAVRRSRLLRPETLGEMLLDQRVCAGIGNIYKCESLWQLHLDPWLSPAELDDAQLTRLFSCARKLMRAGLHAHTVRAVHGRARHPCPRCHTPISVRAQGEHARLTYFCSRCQARG